MAPRGVDTGGTRLVLAVRLTSCSPSKTVTVPATLGAWLTGVMATVTTWLVSRPPAPSSTVMRKVSLVGASTWLPLWV
jgi:hypothetical protein